MGDIIKARKGIKASIDHLLLGEFGFTTDEERVYIGGNNGNVPLPNATDLSENTQQIAESSKLGYASTTISDWKSRIESFYVNIKDFEAVGDGTTDDTIAIQSAINYSCSNGYPMIKIPNGIYKITATLTTPQTFKQPIIIGDNPVTTILDGSTLPANSPCIKFKGGSGALANSYISNISFIGNANSIGIEFADVCGMKAINCKFGLNGIGIQFHNEGINAFTEYIIADGCDFASNCATAIAYMTTNGVRSFHGSGLKDCTINQSVTETKAKILIGTGCLPYNAPLSFQCWTRNAVPIIKNLGLNATFYGNITVEPSGTVRVELCDSTNGAIRIVGSMISNNQQIVVGKAIFCERLSLLSDGGIAIFRKQYSIRVPVVAGSNKIADFAEQQGCAFLVTVYFRADFYDYGYVLLCYQNPYDANGTVTILQTPKNFNQSGYGGWTFTISNNGLYATNNTIPNITSLVNVQQIGSKNSYLL